MRTIYYQIRVFFQNGKSTIPSCFFHTTSDLLPGNLIPCILQSPNTRQCKHCKLGGHVK